MIKAKVKTFPKGVQICISDKCPYCGGKLRRINIERKTRSHIIYNAFTFLTKNDISVEKIKCEHCGISIEVKYFENSAELEEVEETKTDKNGK